MSRKGQLYMYSNWSILFEMVTKPHWYWRAWRTGAPIRLNGWWFINPNRKWRRP